MTRIAHCCCGSLRAEATGEPVFVVACHCTQCQCRTGSTFGVSTYSPKEQVRTGGPSKVYVRGSDSGRKVEFISARAAALRCSGMRNLPPILAASPLARSPTRRCLGRRYRCGHPWVIFDHQPDRFLVQPKIDDLELELPTREVANDRNGKVCVSHWK